MKKDYIFNGAVPVTFDMVMGFDLKIRKHIENNNPDRVKDYLCKAYDTFNPSSKTYKNHPCFEFISEGLEFLKRNGWITKISTWGGEGRQLTLVSPDGSYYCSHYDHSLDDAK